MNPDPLDVTRSCDRCGRAYVDEDERALDAEWLSGFDSGFALARSSSKAVLLALGVGAALGFVAGWVAR